MLKLSPVLFQHNTETKWHVKNNRIPRLHSRPPYPGKSLSPEVLSSWELHSREGYSSPAGVGNTFPVWNSGPQSHTQRDQEGSYVWASETVKSFPPTAVPHRGCVAI